MGIRFSARSMRLEPSAIRNKMFDDHSLISFAAGKPEQTLFPLQEIVSLVEEILLNDGCSVLQYSSTEGLPELRQIIAGQLMAGAGVTTSPNEIALSSGSQEGIEMAARLLIDEGDAIVCENPSYLGAYNAFRPYGARLIPVDMDENGMRMDELEQILSSDKGVKMIYTIPDFQNPSGVTMSDDRRRQLAELAARYRVLVIEDCPYSDLIYSGTRHSAIKSYDQDGWVVYLGTFSKIFCPGLRLGWVCANSTYLSKYIMAKQAANLQCGSLDERIVLSYLKKYDIIEHVARLKAVYGRRRDTMLNAMKAHFPKEVEYNHPLGGFFVWVKLREDMDTQSLLMESAAEAKVAFVPGAPFFGNERKQNYLRLNFSFVDEERINIGIQRLGELLRNKYNC